MPLCADCRRGYPEKYFCVTKSRAVREYRLGAVDLARLPMYEVDNPHYKVAAPMKLYLLRQVRQLAKAKYGGDEPYNVQLVAFPESQLHWFEEDPTRLRHMSPGAFQRLIADRLDAMGLEVKTVGDVFRRDGGIDLLAFPKADRCAFPFLIAVQVKHHRTSTSTTVSDVRDFHGAIMSRGAPLAAGILVTNTRFTADAKWFAEQNAALLRLRDLKDLKRWLRNDFINDAEWREIPAVLELAPGVTIALPRRLSAYHADMHRGPAA